LITDSLVRPGFGEGDGGGAQRPKRQAEGDAQDDRKNRPHRGCLSLPIRILHKFLLRNCNPRRAKLRNRLAAALRLYFIASFSAGRVARNAALALKQTRTRNRKRGGAWLPVHVCLSSDAFRATHR